MSSGSASLALDPLGLFGEALDEAGEGVDALVDLAVAAGNVAGGDALEDDRQLPVTEGDVEVEVGEVAAAALGVAGFDLLAAREAGRQVGGHAEGESVPAALGQAGHQQAQGGRRGAGE